MSSDPNEIIQDPKLKAALDDIDVELPRFHGRLVSGVDGV